MAVTLLRAEQMKQREWQGEQRRMESERGSVCVNVLLICRAIKRVKGSRWAARAPSVRANELPEFTAQTRLHVRTPARRGLDSRVENHQRKIRF